MTAQTEFSLIEKEAQIYLQTSEFLQKESGDTIVLGSKFSLYCDDIMESDEFQNKLSRKAGDKQKTDHDRLSEVLQSIMKYQRRLQRKQKQVLELPIKEKEMHPDAVIKILKDAKFEILRKCAGIE
ncbi:hypothetical protein Ngar_c10750 [Candidatus Nitrososphaera gargensis Ga9.2]|uniref:Uncharacterized protein n=1 Tax=Nitrososphaera gargensis (strain Ga9.2) TaxID=1237085 RepID=K0IIS9_NITGG|nr:hypothetical protein [Candidatus Nitrososphaera gargensis]AFU58017.1 hypothetical protein Ngar_c10750 [Candidatus Nitrososphaera gargensis Ga9.2]